jgi:response regulator of citrate/malate metabolism
VKVLAIDDSKDILFAISAICDYQGWESISAKDAELGLELFRKHKPDIVLVDYHMPGINGIEAVRMLRSINKSVPLIVLTVEEKSDIADEFMQAGASDYALKPIKALDLISRMKVHLRLQQGYGSNIESEEDLKKGISRDTLEIISEYLKKQVNHVTLKEVSLETGLAYQTVHRYMQYLMDNGKAEVKLDYGRQGRPMNKYSVRKKKF